MNRPWYPGMLLPHLQPQPVVDPRFLMPPPATPETVRAEIEHAIIRDEHLEPPTVHQILRDVSRATAVSIMDIRGIRRYPHLVGARHLVFWLSRRHTDKSLSTIGRIVGANGMPKDHTTVLNGIRRLDRAMTAEGIDLSQVGSVAKEIDTVLGSAWARVWIMGSRS